MLAQVQTTTTVLASPEPDESPGTHCVAERSGSLAAPSRPETRRSVGLNQAKSGHSRCRHHTELMLEAAFIVVPVLAVSGLIIVWSQMRRHR
jgi:hypothetical protein